MLARERKSPSAKKIRPGFANVEEAQKGHRDHCDDCPELFALAVRHAAFAPFFLHVLPPADRLTISRQIAKMPPIIYHARFKHKQMRATRKELHMHLLEVVMARSGTK